MEKTIKEYMEYIWKTYACRSPLRLCRWYTVRDEQGHFYFIGLRRGINKGHNHAED